MKQPDDVKWRVLESRYLGREPWFTVRCERVELPNGAIVPRYFVYEYPEWVNVIAITANGDFIIIDQYRHGLQRTDYELVAGVVEDDDESLEAAARRELMEETGYGGGVWRHFMSLCANPATQNNMTHTFIAEQVTQLGKQQLDASEDLRVHRVSREQIHSLLGEGRIVQALHAAPLWRYLYESEKPQ